VPSEGEDRQKGLARLSNPSPGVRLIDQEPNAAT